MKKLLAITNHFNPSPEVPLIFAETPKGMEIHSSFWNQLLYFYDGKNKHTLFFETNKKPNDLTPLDKYDGLYIRSDGPVDNDTMSIVLREAERRNIPKLGFHPYVGGSRIGSKADTMHFCNTNLDMLFPMSFFGKYTMIEKYFDTIVKKIGLPFVCKPNNLSKGRGVSLIHSKKELKKYFSEILEEYGTKKSYFLAQKYIKNKGDVRVLVIGKKTHAIRRYTEAKDEFRNNVSLGGETQKITISTETKKLMKKIVKKLNLDFAGIDYIEYGKKQIFLEVNRTPGLTGVSGAHNKNMFKETMDYIYKKIK
ncbi:hypothetical protein C0581_02740 [Candidatus Parcubacteria bacterium]|nr:MAG: hypothetical protein C0581_02740 [Candidatus Parcubacteria bacterium]